MPSEALMALIAYVLLTCFLSAFFSLAEASIVALSEYRVKAFINHTVGGEPLLRLYENKKANLSTALFLNTTVNIAGVAAVGAKASQLLIGLEYKVFVLALTLAMLVFSEVKPKVYASSHPEKVANKLAKIMLALTWCCRPFVAFIYIFLKREDTDSNSVSAIDIRSILVSASEKGVIDKSELKLAQNVFNLGSVRAGALALRDVPLTTLPVYSTLGEALEIALHKDHKRIVATSKTGEPVGVFLQRDILRAWCEAPSPSQSIADLLYSVKLVDADCSLARLASDLYRAPNHFAIVMDSDGSVAGVITLSNIQELLLT